MDEPSQELLSPESVVPPLGVDQMIRRSGYEDFEFETTADLEPLDGILGQPRASEALEFAVQMDGDGFNVFALGPEDTDKQTVARHFIEQQASGEAAPRDLCYVNNFEVAHRPRALRLPAGTGRALADDVDEFLRELRPALVSAFESEDYQTRRQAIQQDVGEEQGQAFEELRDKAREHGLAIIRTPAGFAFPPIKDGEVLSPDEWEELGEEEREELEQKTEELEAELQQLIRQVPRRQRELRNRLEELNQEVARWAVDDLLTDLRDRYSEFSEVTAHLDAVEEDIVESVEQLVGGQDDQGMQGGGESWGMVSPVGAGQAPLEAPSLRKYRVNVVVDHSDSEQAPVVYEDHPNHQNLVGRVEYQALMGALITDFNMIKPGALHRANGGYLLLDARQVLLKPLAWEELKRALKAGEIRVESPQQVLGMVRTVSLEPEPVDLDVTVVLMGSRLLYYLIDELDPDFPRLFKVAADFADRMDRDPENETLYARMIAGMAEQDGLPPFHRDAVGRVIERSARLAGDGEKLSARSEGIRDLLKEAGHWARQEDAEVVRAEHIQKAIDKWTYRSDRIRERVHEQILRDTLYIDSDGTRQGQVNGLSVLQVGEFSFGRPNRITARVRLGQGEVVDIEREVELGGPIHSKGVMILSGFLGARYATDQPLSLSATLVFEQSYGGVEGDSASSAELYALLSAISELPLRQSVAVTGSVNQHGDIQPIGGVNEKVEGFFDICAARGLTGAQGVLVPASNVKHLMLREDVLRAVDDGEFHVWAIESVDQGMEILSGVPMGEPDEAGEYPEGTVNRRVKDRLAELARRRKEYSRPSEDAE